MSRRPFVFHRLDELPATCSELFSEASARQGFFLSLEWFRLLSQEGFLQEVAQRIYVVAEADGSTPTLILPMASEPSAGNWRQPRRLMALANFYSSLFGPLTKEPDTLRELDWNVLAQQIASDHPAWDVVTLAPMALDSCAFRGLRRALESNGMRVQDYLCFGNWYARVNGRSFSQYWNNLPARMRNTVERRKKKLVSADRIKLKVFSDAKDMDEGIACYEQVYGKSWKKPEPAPGFMPALMSMCATHGWARLGVAYIDGVPAAVQFWIVHHKVASIYKLAYDESYAQYSIGSILTAFLLEHVIDIDCVEEIDYLTGDDSYKADWMHLRRERWGLVAFNQRTLKGRFLGSWHVGRRAVKARADAILHHVLRARR